MIADISTIVMLLIYASITLLFLIMIKRAIRSEGSIRVVELPAKQPIGKPFPRILFVLKSLKPLITNLLTATIVTAIIITSILSAMAASSRVSQISARVEHGLSKGKLLLIKFTAPVSRHWAAKLLSKYFNYSRPVIHYLSIYTLRKPIKLRYGNSTYNIFVLVGAEKKVILQLAGTNLNASFISTDLPPGKESMVSIILGNGTVLTLKMLGIPASRLEGYTIADDVYLLPVQMYVGRKPILTPPKFVLLGLIGKVNELVGEPAHYATELLAYLNADVKAKYITELITGNPLIRAVVLVKGSTKYIFSKGRIPSTQSILAALASSALAAVLSLSMFASLAPHVRLLYSKLNLIGAPRWVISIVNSAYSILVVLIPGIIMSAIIFTIMGDVQSFNALISTLITWISSIIYLKIKVRAKSLMTDVYVKPLNKLTLTIPKAGIKEILLNIDKALKTNEFFSVEGSELVIRRGEGILRARLHYLPSWGIWVDVEAEAIPENDIVYLSIQCFTRSVESVSKKIENEVIALITSRIDGVIKSCLES